MKQSKFIYKDNERFALRTIGIKKNYGKNEVLKGINFEVKKGERVAILGRNGSGKSTFISLITQQRAFYDGTIIYGYADTKSKALELLGVQFQNLSYPEGFFVKDVLKLFQSAVPLGIRLTKHQLDDLINLFGIKPYLKQRIDKLSGGQQQRVNIILSLIKRPKLLILDEISSGLDVKSSTEIKNYIKKYLQLDKEVSLIIVSHNIEEVKELTKTSYVLKDGLIDECFPSANLTEDKFMNIVSVDIEAVARNIEQANRIIATKKVNKEYETMKSNYVEEITKKSDKFIHNLDFHEVYRLQEELEELKTPEFKVKLTTKITEKTATNKAHDKKELDSQQKELEKDVLYKRIQFNETKLLELKSKEFKEALSHKLVPKHKKDRQHLETKIEEQELKLKEYTKDHSLSGFDQTIGALKVELANLMVLKNKDKEPKHNHFLQEVTNTVNEYNNPILKTLDEEDLDLDKEINLANDNIKKVNQMKKELVNNIAAENKKISFEKQQLDHKMKIITDIDRNEITNIVKKHIFDVSTKLAKDKEAISLKEKQFENAKLAFAKKYQDQPKKDKDLIITIIEKEIALRIKELSLLENKLTKEQGKIVLKQQTYTKELATFKKEIPSKIIQLKKEAELAETERAANIASHDKSYEDSWTNKIYDFLDKEKKNFYIDPPKKGNILEIRHISKNFKKLQAVRSFSLNIKDGERIAITGPNGSGKSTIVSMIAQLIKPDFGEIAYSFGKTKRSVINNVGVQFQNSSFPQEMSVFDVVIFFARANRYSLTKNEIHKALEVFKLDDLKRNKAYLLSGGEKQRLNVLLALIKKPKLVILDEISTGLDVDSIHKINGYVKEYLDETKATLIIISHNYEEIYNLTDKLVVLDYGVKTDEYDIRDWTQQQIKDKMFEIYSKKETRHHVPEDFIYNPDFKQVYLLQEELVRLNSKEFKKELIKDISENVVIKRNRLQHDFDIKEKEFIDHPLYRDIKSSKTKLFELNSKEFSDALFAKLIPKHKKDRHELDKKLNAKKTNLKKYINSNSTKQLDKTIANLEQVILDLDFEKINKLNQKDSKDTLINLAEVKKINHKIDLVKIQIQKIILTKKEILDNINKQVLEITKDEDHLEDKMNVIISKDEEDIKNLIQKYISNITQQLNKQNRKFKKYNDVFTMVKKEFDKKYQEQILEDKTEAEIIIKQEKEKRIKELEILAGVLTKEQNSDIVKKKYLHNETPKLNKAIALQMKNLVKISNQKHEEEFNILNKEENK